MKQLLFLLIGILLPITLMAQGAGGEIRRPVRANTNTNSVQSRPVNNTPPRTNNTNNRQSSNSARDAILQKLINNMIQVEGGTLMVGATSEQGNDAFEDEKPIHLVTISSFYIGKYEVTQEEWSAVMGSNPSTFISSNNPVNNVSWIDCQNFIRELNKLTGKNFRLPTEAEWEFAARGGNKSNNYKYAGSHAIGLAAWYKDNSSKTIHSVGSSLSNELGLYDMSGNVNEWCQDWKGSYSAKSVNNPSGPTSGSSRIIRGGSWNSNAQSCRVSFRNSFQQDYRNDDLGFRLAMAENVNSSIQINTTPSGSTRAQNNNVGSSSQFYNNPSVLLNKDKSLKLLDVTVNKVETVLTFSFKNDRGSQGMNIDRNAYLYADGIKFALKLAVGIAYSPNYTSLTYQGETKRFELHFEALPQNTIQFDFIENDNSVWKMYGISLKN